MSNDDGNEFVPDGTPENAFWRVRSEWVGSDYIGDPREMQDSPLILVAASEHESMWAKFEQAAIPYGDAAKVSGSHIGNAYFETSDGMQVEMQDLSKAFRTGRLAYWPAGRFSERVERAIALPVHVYGERGDVRMSIGDNDSPDGYIFAILSMLNKHYGWKKITPKREREITLRMRAEVAEYSDWLQGNVHRMIVEHAVERDGAWTWVADDDDGSTIVFGSMLGRELRDLAERVVEIEGVVVDVYTQDDGKPWYEYSDHPALNDDLLAKAEWVDREMWWLSGGRLLVNSVLWAAAYNADVEHEIEIAYFNGFVSWAAAYGVDVYEKEEWGINGDYSIDTEWVDAVAAETYKSKGE